jgi:hypothetical protein
MWISGSKPADIKPMTCVTECTKGSSFDEGSFSELLPIIINYEI